MEGAAGWAAWLWSMILIVVTHTERPRPRPGDRAELLLADFSETFL